MRKAFSCHGDDRPNGCGARSSCKPLKHLFYHDAGEIY